MFSIADLQSEDEIDTPEAEVEGEGNEEGEDDAPYHAYPVRVSLSIVKVGFRVLLERVSELTRRWCRRQDRGL